MRRGAVRARAGEPRGALPQRAVTFLAYLAFLFLLLEGAALLLSRLPGTRAVLFSGGAAFVEQLGPMEGLYRQFVADRYNAVLGWDNPRATAPVKHVCAGHTVTETYLADRSRRTPEVAGRRSILAVGDSFTLGAEVEDDDSYPAQLSQLIGRKVINHGVGGYCPLQAVLKFRQRAREYPEARTVVLGITQEDIPRMLNAYRPALFLHTSGVFSFKPYMRGAIQAANPNGPEPAPFDVFVERARRAFREDYWALAEPRFPYSLALLDSLSRPIVRLRVQKEIGRSSALLQEEDVRVALRALLEDFVAAARALGMAPVILFIPNEPGHRDAFDDLVTGLRAAFGARAAVAAVRDEGYQWDKYLPNPNCHPGAYGYRVIAEHAARAVREADDQSALESPKT
jgi:lysophospholipase L1-like esterase